MRIADTLAADLAQQAWWGNDAPGEITEFGVRVALDRTFGQAVTLEDVAEWAHRPMFAIAEASTQATLHIRFIAALTAAMILGAKLRETNAT